MSTNELESQQTQRFRRHVKKDSDNQDQNNIGLITFFPEYKSFPMVPATDLLRQELLAALSRSTILSTRFTNTSKKTKSSGDDSMIINCDLDG